LHPAEKLSEALQPGAPEDPDTKALPSLKGDKQGFFLFMSRHIPETVTAPGRETRTHHRLSNHTPPSHPFPYNTKEDRRTSAFPPPSASAQKQNDFFATHRIIRIFAEKDIADPDNEKPTLNITGSPAL
jgi:hypothetical protein